MGARLADYAVSGKGDVKSVSRAFPVDAPVRPKKSPGPYATAAAGQQCQQHQHPNCPGPFVNLYIQLRAPYVPLLPMNHFS